MLINQLLKVSASFGLIYQCDSCPKFLGKYPYIFIAAAMMVGKRMPISSFSHVTLHKILQLYWPLAFLKTFGHKCIILKKRSFRVMKRFLRVKHEIASIVVMQ